MFKKKDTTLSNLTGSFTEALDQKRKKLKRQPEMTRPKRNVLCGRAVPPRVFLMIQVIYDVRLKFSFIRLRAPDRVPH